MIDRILDLPEGARKALFALVVLLLVAAGAWAVLGDDKSTPAPAAEPSASDQPSTGPQADGGATTPTPGATDDTTPDPVAASGALTAPVDGPALAAAADAASRYAQQSTSYRYDRPADAWLAELTPLLSNTSQVDLYALVPQGAAAQAMAESQTSIQADAAATDVLFMAPGLVSLVVEVHTATTSTEGTTQATSMYEITVSLEQGKWLVQEVALRGGSGSGAFE